MEEKRCPVCGATLKVTDESGLMRCLRCGTEAAFEEGELASLEIPGYELRLREIGERVRELNRAIDIEGSRGDARDMQRIQRFHHERQELLSEYSFLEHFEAMVERHRHRHRPS